MAGPVGNGMGIGAFYNQALQKDFSRDHQMRVISIGPGGFIKQEDNVYITTAVLPGYNIANQAVPYMGLQFNVPGSGNFPGSDAWVVTFRCDAQLNLREKILGWQKSVFNAFPDDALNSVGAYGPKGIDTYADLAVFDRDGKSVRSLKLIGCYPTSLGEIAYDATANGNVVTMPVTLAYQWWTSQGAFSGSVVP
jgi:hypothetical protein